MNKFYPYVIPAILLVILTGAGILKLVKPNKPLTQQHTTKQKTESKIQNEHPDFYFVISRKARDEFVKDKHRVCGQIHLKPIPVGGDKISGAEISFIEKGSVFEEVFREKDIVLKINNSPLNTLPRLLNLFDELKSCDKISVLIKREDKLLLFVFEFK